MNIAFVCSEVAPFSKTGGLADVAGALPVALAHLGHNVKVYTPYYRSAKKVDPNAKQIAKGTVPAGGAQMPWTLHASTVPLGDAPLPGSQPSPLQKGHAQVCFIGCDAYFDRDGLYGAEGRDYEDNCNRFAFFSQACLAAAQAEGDTVDLWHCHDWQTGLIPVYLRTTHARQPFFARAASVFTIHNLSYRGMFWHWDWPLLNLPWQHFNWRELEYYGKMSLLKGALVYADLLVTVSPTYAEEIQTPVSGCGLHGVLAERKDRLFGIVNGIDANIWNPRKDALLPANYGPGQMDGKKVCKDALRRKLGLAQDGSAVVGMIGRVVQQKGFDLVTQGLEQILQRDVQLVVLGTGEEQYQQALQKAQAAHPGKVGLAFAFDDGMAHLIEAGSDIFLMPSQYEPCGLVQLYALEYGTVPVVRKVGGLADTVTDTTPETLEHSTATGFMFGEYQADAMLGGLDRALDVYFKQPDVWQDLQRNGMNQDWTWQHSAIKYLDVYERALRLRLTSQPASF
jgi:starch synthase